MGIAEAFSLDGKVAIIAGVGDTNSRHIALALAEAGADLALVARRKAFTVPLAEEIRAAGRRAIVIAVDLTDRMQVDALAEQVQAELGRIDQHLDAGAGAALYLASPASSFVTGSALSVTGGIAASV